MLVAPVVGKDGDATMVMQPAVVVDDIMGGVPQVDLSGPNGHGQGLAVCDELVALMSIGRIGRGAQGQFQAELAVEVGGCEVTVAKDLFFLRWVLGVDV